MPKELGLDVVFDQSLFVKRAIETLLHEGGIGLVLTALMVLVFLGSFRATIAVFLSIPLSALAAFIALYFGGSSINTMILAGLALVFSRLIDNAVIVLENIFRHLEMGEPPEVAAEKGGEEVSLAVLAATLTSSVVFFPVTFLYGVSRFLFSALALAVVLSLFASYFVALTVVPLFCAKLIKAPHHAPPVDGAAGETPAMRRRRRTGWSGSTPAFTARFERCWCWYEQRVRGSLRRPGLVLVGVAALFVASLMLYPLLGVAFFPRTDAGQFVINLKSPSGTRIEVSTQDVQKVEALVRRIVDPKDLELIVVEHRRHRRLLVDLHEQRRTAHRDDPGRAEGRAPDRQLRVHGPRAHGDPARAAGPERLLPVGRHGRRGAEPGAAGADRRAGERVESRDGVRRRERPGRAASATLPGVSDVFIPQDVDYPSLRLDIDRERAGELGLDQREVVNNVITALTSNEMIAPSYWVDPKSGNDYMLTVQYPENQIQNLRDLRDIPLHSGRLKDPTMLDAVTQITPLKSPTEIDHYQIQRVIDIYVNPAGEDLGRLATGIRGVIAAAKLPPSVRIALRGMVQGMQASFQSFGLGLILALVLLYLILVAQFRSFTDPLLILLAVPPGLTGVLLALYADRHDAQRAVADGRADDGRHGGVEQHPDRRVHASARRGRDAAARRGGELLPHPAAADSDDVAGDDLRADSDGAEARDRQRGVRAAGARDHRRPGRLGRGDRLRRAGRLPDGLSPAGGERWRREARS